MLLTSLSRYIPVIRATDFVGIFLPECIFYQGIEHANATTYYKLGHYRLVFLTKATASVFRSAVVYSHRWSPFSYKLLLDYHSLFSGSYYIEIRDRIPTKHYCVWDQMTYKASTYWTPSSVWVSTIIIALWCFLIRRWQVLDRLQKTALHPIQGK